MRLARAVVERQGARSLSACRYVCARMRVFDVNVGVDPENKYT